MAIFYSDYENGNDVTTATPLGWWSVEFTNGSGTEPLTNEIVTGASSSATAKITIIGTLSGGSWGGSDAAGTMYFYGKSATDFESETVNCAEGGSFDIANDFTYCAWKTLTSGATSERIAPGDIIRLAKSLAPTSIGDATWTTLSKTVTLDSAQTANIDMCETIWTKILLGTQQLQDIQFHQVQKRAHIV